MRKILATLLVLIALSTTPVYAARRLCVFTIPAFSNEWDELKPDIKVTAKDWRYLDEFLKKTQKKYYNYEDDELVIDIDCHGDPDTGELVISNHAKTSMGSVLKRIQEFFPERRNMVVIFESCFAGRCYKMGIRGMVNSYLPGSCDTAPEFPVYGERADLANIGLLAYLQYAFKIHPWLRDLRTYESAQLEPVKDITLMEMLFGMYKPVYSLMAGTEKTLMSLYKAHKPV